MTNPDTSAQGEYPERTFDEYVNHGSDGPEVPPVASQEAEARFDETAENALRFFGLDPRDEKAIGDQLALMFVYVDDGSQYSWETRDALHTGLVAAYAAVIRASERERYAALVAAATEVRDLPMLRGESGVGATYTVTYQDTGASERLEAALAALEEAGSE